MFLALTEAAGRLRVLKDKMRKSNNVHRKQSVFQDKLPVITGKGKAGLQIHRWSTNLGSCAPILNYMAHECINILLALEAQD